MAYVGELSFMQSLGLVIRQRRVVVRIRFAPPIDATDATRRELAATCRVAVASLLGLEAPGTAPRTGAGHAAAPQ